MIGIPAATSYIEDDRRVEDFAKQGRVVRVEDVENTHAERFGLMPFLVGAFLGFGGQKVIGNFRWNPGRFQLRTAGVQYRLRSFELADQGVGGTEPESANQGHAEGGESAGVEVHAAETCSLETVRRTGNHCLSWIGGVAAAKPQTGWLFRFERRIVEIEQPPR